MSHEALVCIEAWPPGGGVAAHIKGVGGSVSVSAKSASRELKFNIPEDDTFAVNDYSALQLLRRGSRVRVTVTDDGNLGGGRAKVIFDDYLWDLRVDRRAGAPQLIYTMRDSMTRQRCLGVRMSRSTRMLLYEDTFAPADFNPADTNFLVDLPDNTPGAPNEFVPQAMAYLSAYGSPGGGDEEVHEFTPDEYVYDAATKQIYFKFSQLDYKNDNYEWKFVLYYYDPDDDTNTVKEFLKALLTGAPWSGDGGMGFTAADMTDMAPYDQIEEIVGFDGVTPKKIRTVLACKLDGAIIDLLDQLRDDGLIPRNYWIRKDPDTGKIRGSYIEQDDHPVYDLRRIITDSEPYTLEGIAGRVEMYSKAYTPENYALGATVTEVIPVNHVGAPYDVVGDKDHIVDGKAHTFVQYQHTVTTLDYDPVSTAPDCLVLDLGEAKWVDRVQVRGSHPMELSGGNYIDWRIYLVTRLPKMTVSGSLDRIAEESTTVVFIGGPLTFNVADAAGFVIGDRISVDVVATGLLEWTTITNIVGPVFTVDAAVPGIAIGDTVRYSNPGVPVSTNAICVTLDPQNVGTDDGMCFDVECDIIKNMRYVAVRWEQDFFFRQDGNRIPPTHRMSWFGMSEIKVLSAGRFIYIEGVDKGDVPYAQLTDIADVVAGFTNGGAGAADITFTADPNTWLLVGDTFQVRDQNGVNDPITYTATVIAVGAPWVVDVAEAIIPGDVVLGDDIGWRKRWMLDLKSAYRDLYHPLLYQKITNTSYWLEIVSDERPDTLQEAEGLAVERLIEMISIHDGHDLLIALDTDVDIGLTVRTQPTTADWLVNDIEYMFGPSGQGRPRIPVTMRLRGTNYEGDLQ